MNQKPIGESPTQAPQQLTFRQFLAPILVSGSLVFPAVAMADPVPCQTPEHCLPPTATVLPTHPIVTAPHPPLLQTHSSPQHNLPPHQTEHAHFHAGLAAEVLTLRIPTASGRGFAMQPGSISAFFHENWLFPIGHPDNFTTQHFYIGAGVSGGVAMVNMHPVLQATAGIGTGFRIHYFSIGLVAEGVGRIATTDDTENTFHIQAGPVLCIHPHDQNTSLCLSPQEVFEITADSPTPPATEVALRFTGVLGH